jgi:hypothetical protein
MHSDDTGRTPKVETEEQAIQVLLYWQDDEGRVRAHPTEGDTVETDAGWAFFNVKKGYLGTVTREGAVVMEAEFESAEQHAARVNMRYLSGVPKQVPPGRVVVHNNVRARRLPTDFTFDPGKPEPQWRKLREDGFRAWTQLPEERLVVCDCGWAPHLSEHYRVKAGSDV